MTNNIGGSKKQDVRPLTLLIHQNPTCEIKMQNNGSDFKAWLYFRESGTQLRVLNINWKFKLLNQVVKDNIFKPCTF